MENISTNFANFSVLGVCTGKFYWFSFEMFKKQIPNLIALGAIGYYHSKDRAVHMDVPVHPVIIIGSGPAAHTAAIYSARANLNPGIISL